MSQTANQSSYPVREDEQERIESLEDYEILDTSEDETYDNLTQLAAHFFDVPVVLLSLMDEDRQWFKSVHGWDTRETERSCAFCNYTLVRESTLVVEDAMQDDRFRDNPLVEHDPNIRFYAGHPLYSKDDLPIGTFCLIDRTPRSFSAQDDDNLRYFAHQAESLLDMHLREKQLEQRNRELEEAREELNELLEYKESLLGEVHHRVKNNLQSISSFLRLQSRELDEDRAQSAISESEQRVRAISLIHERLHMDDRQTQLDFPDYLKDLVPTIFQAHTEQARNVEYEINIDVEELDVQKVVPLGLFITEAVMNALQHAFVDQESGRIEIDFHDRSDEYELVVSDNGIGFEPEKTDESFGFRLLKTLGTGQLSGDLTVWENNGTIVTLNFPREETS